MACTIAKGLHSEEPWAWFNTQFLLLEFLRVVFLNFCFVCETWWDNEACSWKEKIHGIHVFFAEFKLTHDMWELVRFKASIESFIYDRASRSLTSPRGRDFYSNQNLLWMQKEGNDIFRDMNDQENLSHPFIANHLCWNWRHRSKMKEWHIITFPLSLC